MDYFLASSAIDRKGFIDKSKILEYVTEEEIFNLVFGYLPEEGDLACSPFREDRDPGAWFERSSESGKLKFVDFADEKAINQDCFDCVQRYFRLPNFYQTLEFVFTHLIEGKELVKIDYKKEESLKKNSDKKVHILINSRNFNNADRAFWGTRYGICRNDLLEDKVVPVKRVTMLNTKNGNVKLNISTLCYAYTDFEGGRKKLYFPYKKGKDRFRTSCGKNDIGGVNFLRKDVYQVLITKSYKDYRVLRNSGCNVIWFQNEGMYPEDSILIQLLSTFTDVVIWFDNDIPGINASKKLLTHLRSLSIKSRSTCLNVSLLENHIKDPSDCRFKLGQEYLNQFLKSNNILCLK